MTQGPNSTSGSSMPRRTEPSTSEAEHPHTVGTPSEPTTQSGLTASPESNVTDEAQRTATHVVNRAGSVLSSKLSEQKRRAASGLNGVADALRTTSRTLAENDTVGASHYVEQAADSIDRFTRYVERHEIGEIVDDVEDVARRNPWVFLGGAFALGILGARFLKSSRTSSASNRRATARRAVATSTRQTYPPPTAQHMDRSQYSSRAPFRDAPRTLHSPDGVIPDSDVVNRPRTDRWEDR